MSLLILSSVGFVFFVCLLGIPILYGKIYRTLSNLTESVKHQKYIQSLLCCCLCVYCSFREDLKNIVCFVGGSPSKIMVLRSRSHSPGGTVVQLSKSHRMERGGSERVVPTKIMC